jgi:hypothetical protein
MILACVHDRPTEHLSTGLANTPSGAIAATTRINLVTNRADIGFTKPGNEKKRTASARGAAGIAF